MVDIPQVSEGSSTQKLAEGECAVISLKDIFEPFCDSLESGVLLVGSDDRISVCSFALAVMFGSTPEAMVGMTVTAFNTLALGQIDDPPKLLRDRGLWPACNTVLCEEFEISRPSRAVTRWVAHRVRCPYYAMVAIATDITANVDLTNAYERMALTDRLTGIANRRGVEREIRQELLRLRRYQTPVSFVIFDIDHFKAINDSRGHGAGDEVLRQVAKTIAAGVRDTDLVARWGGEEFLVVLPETAYTGALICAEKVRARVETLSEQIGFRITISGGVYQPEPDESMGDLLSRADARLYEAKNSGRNRIC